MKYKSKYNYDGRYAVLHTSGLKSDKEKKDGTDRYAVPREHEFIAILPLGVFLDLFSTAEDVEEKLRERAEVVIAQWNVQNKHKSKIGRRSPVGMTWDLCRCEWKTNKGRSTELSKWCLQISTFNYTINHQQDLKPEISLQDLKVKSRDTRRD
jgi:hypothetical protein